jgi:metallo-beta-lactamase class B
MRLWILNSHAHFDHAGDIAQLMHDTGAQWTSCESKRCLHMIDVASLSAPGYKLIGNPRYPDIVNDFEHSFAVVAALPCDVALAPHPGVVNFWARVARREQGDPNAMIDPSLCRAITKDARESFEVLLAKQRADTASAK